MGINIITNSYSNKNGILI